jgi:hypothetical protein
MRREETAHKLEELARKTLNVASRYSMGGIVETENIESGGAFTIMCAMLAPYYKLGNDEQKAIIAVFIKEYDMLKNMPINDQYFEALERLYEDLNSLISKLDKTVQY